MKRALLAVLAVAAPVAVAVGIFLLWQGRPWRPVLSVNGQVLTLGELNARAKGLMEDAQRNGGLIVPDAKRAEAMKYFSLRAAKLWTFKRVMLDEAVRRGLSVSPEEAAKSLESMEKRLATRKMTIDGYFKRGPLPEAALREEFREGVLVNRLLDEEVRSKVKLDADAVSGRLVELRRRAEETARATGKPVRRVSRKEAIVSVSSERYRDGVKALYESLLAAADVKSDMFATSELRAPEVPPAEDE